jgi:hypothetical protein
MPRLLAPLLALVVLLNACQPAPTGDSLTETPATATPTETTIPATLTETPDPLSRIDLQNPATYPEWMSYFTRGEFPSVEAQKTMSADMFHLYRILLIDRGVEDVESMLDSQVFFMAGQIANQEGWNLPANLDATRAWFAGPQGAAHSSLDGTHQDGIFFELQLGDRESDTLTLAQTPGEITADVFGESVLLQRVQPFFGARADEAILVDLTNGKQAIILHYVNEEQDNYMPLAVTFTNTPSDGVIKAPGGGNYITMPSSEIIPTSIGIDGAIGLWTQDALRTKFINAEEIYINEYNGATVSHPLINGLEFAYRIIISP